MILIANTSPWCEKIVSNAGAHHPSVVINISFGWSIAGQLFGPLHVFFGTSRSLLSILAICLLVIGHRCQLLYPWLETAEPFPGSVCVTSSQGMEGRKEMFYLTTHSTHLRLYGVRHMVKDYSDSYSF